MQQSILIQLQHRIFSFNDYIDSTQFNTGYFHSMTIFIQLQHGLLFCKTNIYSTSTPKVMLYETNIFIQLQQKKYIFSFNKTYLFNSSSSRTSINSYSIKLHLPTPCRSFFKNLETTCLNSIAAQEQHLNECFVDIVNLLVPNKYC